MPLRVCWRVLARSAEQRTNTPFDSACASPPPALQIETELIIRGDAVRTTQAVQDPQQPAQQEVAVSDGDSHMYTLRAVVRHVGSSLNSGHYIADVLVRDDSWFRFDDDEPVKRIQRSARARADIAPDGPCAYVLFYERQVEPAFPAHAMARRPVCGWLC